MGQHAFTGPWVKDGQVGFVNITVDDEGVRFMVRAEGPHTEPRAFKMGHEEARRVLRSALADLKAR